MLLNKTVVRGDQIILLTKMVTFGVEKKNSWIIKRISLVMFLFIELMLLVTTSMLISNGDWKSIKSYITMMCLIQPGCGALYMIGTYLDAMNDNVSQCVLVSSTMSILDATFEEKVLKMANWTIVISITSIAICICSHLLFTVPFSYDDEDINVYFLFIMNYHGTIPTSILTILYTFCLIIASVAAAHPLVLSLTLTFHGYFQLYWLLNFVNNNLKKTADGTVSFNDDDRYQEMISNNLKDFVKCHLIIKKGHSMLQNFQPLYLLVLSTSALLVAVSTLYFILAGIKPAANFRLAFLGIGVFFYVVITSVCGQIFTDEPGKLSFNLYDCPWVFWNKRNRRTLHIILLNLDKPWEITFMNIIPLNYLTIAKGARLVYNCIAILYKFK